MTDRLVSHAEPTGRVSCVVASCRPWTRDSAARLEARTGIRVIAIDNPSDLTVDKLLAIAPRFVFFPYWSHRIDARIYEQYECVIFHMTDLPFGRGGSPLQNLIARGIYETKVSAIRCVEEMDAGAVYLKQPLTLHGSAEEIYLRATRVIEEMIVEMIATNPTPTPQEGTATVFKRRTPDQGNVSAAQSLEEMFDLIRMLDADGYPPAFLDIGPFRLDFSRAVRKTDAVLADVRITVRATEGQGSDKP